MKTKYNKLSLFDEQKTELLNNEHLKVNILKEKIIHERQSILQRDGELRKLSEELQNRIINSRVKFKKPIKFTSFLIHQRQSEQQKLSQDLTNISIKEQQQKLQKNEMSIIENNQLDLQNDKYHFSKKQSKIKFKDASKSIFIKSIGQSFHEQSFNIINYCQKPKSKSINDKNNNNIITSYKPIDKYILSQLEDIATDQRDLTQLPTITQNEIKTQKQTQSLFKLLPLTIASQETAKLKGFKCNDEFSNTKLIQDNKIIKCTKNYEITRKAQERITLYQKILRLQNDNRSKSTFIRQLNQRNYNQI